MAFKRAGTASKSKSQPRRAKSRYAGVKAREARVPILTCGDYVLKITDNYETSNPRSGDWFHGEFEVVESNGSEALPEGSVGAFLQGVSGKSQAAGTSSVKGYVMAAAGFDDEDFYDELDPDGYFIDSVTGQANEYSEVGATIVGRYVACVVHRGKMREDGSDYYRDYSFALIDEDDQEVVAPHEEMAEALKSLEKRG